MRLHHAVDLGPGAAAVDVQLEIDVGDDRLVHRVAGRGKDLEHRGARLGILTPQDAEQGRTLLRRCPAIENMDAFAFALVDGPGPAEDCRGLEPVKPGRAMEALFDVEHGQPAAVAAGSVAH